MFSKYISLMLQDQKMKHFPRLQSALDYQYISEEEYNLLFKEYDILGSKIFKRRENWK